MTIHQALFELKEHRAGEALGVILQRRSPQELSDILVVPHEVVPRLGSLPLPRPLTSQPTLGTLPPLPGSDDSDYFHQQISPTNPPLHFLPTDTKASYRLEQFQF